MARLTRLLAVVLLPFALASCVLTPGKFVSTLKIDADRHFAFSYVGEVLALDLPSDIAKGMADDPKDSGDADAASLQKLGFQKKGGGLAPDPAAQKAATDAKNRAIAAALAKEVGYRKVTYLGDGKFEIDYAISGTLDRGFIWPFNLDAEIIFPFVVLEVRGNNTVRLKAPAFANDNDATKNLGVMGGGGDMKLPSQMDGVFTLDTDAEIISQNNEDGAVTGPAGRKTVTWKATPTSKDAPSAVLRFK